MPTERYPATFADRAGHVWHYSYGRDLFDRYTRDDGEFYAYNFSFSYWQIGKRGAHGAIRGIWDSMDEVAGAVWLYERGEWDGGRARLFAVQRQLADSTRATGRDQ